MLSVHSYEILFFLQNRGSRFWFFRPMIDAGQCVLLHCNLPGISALAISDVTSLSMTGLSTGCCVFLAFDYIPPNTLNRTTLCLRTLSRALTMLLTSNTSFVQKIFSWYPTCVGPLWLFSRATKVQKVWLRMFDRFSFLFDIYLVVYNIYSNY